MQANLLAKANKSINATLVLAFYGSNKIQTTLIQVISLFTISRILFGNYKRYGYVITFMVVFKKKLRRRCVLSIVIEQVQKSIRI